MRVEFQVHLLDSETEATTWRIADTVHVVSQLQKYIYISTSNKQM